MNYTPVYGWYYITANERTASWTGVQYLYNFLTSNTGPGPYAVETDISRMQPGDLCQLALNRNEFHHTPVIVAVGNPPTLENILVAAHSRDLDYKPLGTYNYRALRFLHIEGVRTYVPEES